MAIIVLLVVGVSLFGVFGLAFMGLMSSEAKKAQNNAGTIIHETFNGAPMVTYTISKVGGGTLTLQQMLEGAELYGYELYAQSEGQHLTELVFKQIHAPVPPPPGGYQN